MKLEFVTPTRVKYNNEEFVLMSVEADYILMVSLMDGGQIYMPTESGEWAKMQIVSEGGETQELTLPLRPAL